MPKSKYEAIYHDLKEKIESEEYPSGSFLPSENNLIQTYECSRNTLRRALSHLADEGYVHSHHGKGVRVIYHKSLRPNKGDLQLHGIEGSKQLAQKKGIKIRTEVINFTTMEVDERLATKTDFPLGCEIYYIQRVRYLNGIAKMVDNNLIRRDIVPGLTRKIATGSLFDYIENTLKMDVTTIKQQITMERVTPFDEAHLTLDDYNCMAIVTSKSFNSDGIQFEYTESRNRPDIFQFSVVSTTNLKPNY